MRINDGRSVFGVFIKEVRNKGVFEGVSMPEKVSWERLVLRTAVRAMSAIRASLEQGQ